LARGRPIVVTLPVRARFGAGVKKAGFHLLQSLRTPRPSTATADAKSFRSTYSVTINEVLVSTDLAVVRDTWEETLHSPDGRTARRVIQSFEVWQPQPDGHWKISRWISAPGPWQREKA